jgi:hypothetical protein
MRQQLGKERCANDVENKADGHYGLRLGRCRSRTLV